MLRSLRKLQSPIKKVIRVSFLFSAHTALFAYINSSFLRERGIPAEDIGIIYSISSLAVIIGLIVLPYVFDKQGNKNTLIGLIVTNILLVTGLVLTQSTEVTAMLLIAHLATNGFVSFALDLNIEHFTKDKETGNVRGIYFTIYNTAWIIFPLLGSFLLDTSNSHYELVYAIGVILMVISALTALRTIKKYKARTAKIPPIIATVFSFYKNKNLRNIFIPYFLLQLFYSIMVIYTPLYLTQYIGIPWELMGFIFTIMLLPFVLFQAPLGKLADRYFGEKEFLIGGFTILIGSTALLSFVTSTHWLVWALLLFVTRIGASTIEIMTETYFFKNIDDTHADFVSIYRDASPLAYIAGPLLASAFLGFLNIPLQYIFIALAVLIAFFVSVPLTRLEDTQ